MNVLGAIVQRLNATPETMIGLLSKTFNVSQERAISLMITQSLSISPNKQTNQPTQILRSQEQTMSSIFQNYSLEKLKVLVRKINNKDGDMPSGLGLQKIADFYEPHSSKLPFRKLIGTCNGDVEAPELIWKKLTTDFDRLCAQYNLNKQAILEKCLNDRAFRS